MPHSSFFSTKLARSLALIFLFAVALAIRLYDLTDLPLDFHATRQLLSVIKARGLYYQTQPDGFSTAQLEAGIQMAQLKAGVEPVVFERLVAFTYRFTGERIWIARIYSSLFWLIGGAFLFMLVQELVSFDGALFSTAYYLFFPYAVIASRSFQPDPLMVMLILAFCWMFMRWVRSLTWSYALLSGLVGGVAIFIKFSAAFFIIGAALGLVFSRFTFRELLKNTQLWVLAILGAIPALAYLYYGIFIRGSLGGQFDGRFFPALLISPLNYLQWMTKVDFAAGGLFIMLGLLSFFLVKQKQMQGLMIGLWSSYLLYGIFFDYHVATHDYYHLPFIPIVALSLGPLAGWVTAHWTETTKGVGRGVVFIILLYGLFSVVWDVRNQLKAVDYRPDAVMWAEVGQKLDNQKGAIALTQDYGSRLEYWGGRTASIWPSASDLNYSKLRGGGSAFDKLFTEYSGKKAYFLVTDFDELKRQPELRAKLNGYPIYVQGDGYVIYNLQLSLLH
ncbi:MAG: glycosyltransferase family 39 protein [Chloroflexota bacterium]